MGLGSGSSGLRNKTFNYIVKGGAKTGITVLGKFPQYLEVAERIGANKFSIPIKIWNKMSRAEQWAANQKFLDRAISRGDKIILANPILNIKSTSGFLRQELEYLIKKGYRLNKYGTSLTKTMK